LPRGKTYTAEQDAVLLRSTAGDIAVLAERWGRSSSALLNRRNFLRAHENKRPRPQTKPMPQPLRFTRPAWFDENFDDKLRGRK